ncbi:MAG: hypothetical protein WAW57_15290 [Lutibacter sp.]
METKITTIDPKVYGLEKQDADKIKSGLKAILEEREILEDAFNDVCQLEICEENLSQFKQLRLLIVKNRTQGIEKWHKANKEFYLAGGRFVDAIKNKEIAENVRMEESLMAAEKHFEILEKERIHKLQNERISLIAPYVESTIGLDLGNMDAEIFDGFLTGTITKFKARIKAEKEAEEKRLAEEKAEKERIEAQRVENEKLKLEAEKRESEIEEERKNNEAILAKERADAKAKADKIEAENIAKLKAEQDAKAKIEAELKAKIEAEQKAEQLKKDAELKDKIEAEKLAKAPIKKQLLNWVNSFEISKPPVDNEKSKEIYTKFLAFKTWSENNINNI